MKQKIIVVLIAIGFLTILYFILSQKPKSLTSPNVNSNNQSVNINEQDDLIFFWGNGCPHCENVKEFITNNQLDQKLKINQKEVYTNADNKNELLSLINQYCPEIDKNQIGVPFGFDPKDKKCIQGDTPIIDFLKQKSNQ